MLTLSPAVRIYLATGATDLRRAIDGLSALVRDRFTLTDGAYVRVLMCWPVRGAAAVCA